MVLIDLYKIRLFRCRMIWLLPRPPSPVSKLFIFLSIPVSPDELTVGEGVRAEPNHTMERMPGPLKIVQCSLANSVLIRL